MHFLVDYYNLESLHRARGANHVRHSSALDATVRTLVEWLRAQGPLPSDTLIRLYGGWFQDELGTTSTDHDVLRSIVRSFPRRAYRGTRLSIQIAASLLSAPNTLLVSTMRESPGVAPFRVRESCPYGHDPCGLLPLEHWRKGKCPNEAICPARTSQVAFRRAQKLVDSMIVADACYLTYRANESVAVVSNDDDLVPAVLGAVDGQSAGSAALLRLRRADASPYDLVLGESLFDLD